MHIFLLGDFNTNNGPGNANKKIREALQLNYEIEYSKEQGKIKRIYEMYKGIIRSDILVICSASQINYLAVRLAKKFHKKVLYLMHGYSSYERRIENPKLSGEELKKTYDYEVFIYSHADRILCVSMRCMNFMKRKLPIYAYKFDYIFNSIDVKKIDKICKKNTNKRNKNQILSVGGGMRRKNILTIAEAVAESREKKNLVVVGKTLSDGEKIKAFNNVIWYENLEHEELFRVMTETQLYVQNSIFETFGLAVIEALYAGCSILVSNTTGCLDLFNELTEHDVIFDTNDRKEILKKIEYLLSYPNNERLMTNLKKEYLSREWQASRWKEIINSVDNT